VEAAIGLQPQLGAQAHPSQDPRQPAALAAQPRQWSVEDGAQERFGDVAGAGAPQQRHIPGAAVPLLDLGHGLQQQRRLAVAAWRKQDDILAVEHAVHDVLELELAIDEVLAAGRRTVVKRVRRGPHHSVLYRTVLYRMV
jgi:hypothetical protein